MTRYIELKKSGPTLQGALADIQARYKDMTLAHAKLEGDKGALIRLAPPNIELNYITVLTYYIEQSVQVSV